MNKNISDRTYCAGDRAVGISMDQWIRNHTVSAKKGTCLI